jgi:hypothetical protein
MTIRAYLVGDQVPGARAGPDLGPFEVFASDGALLTSGEGRHPA